jgi:type II secretory pathway pseudopilin PulG
MAWDSSSIVADVADIFKLHKFSDRIGELNHVLWWMGWHPVTTTAAGLVIVGFPLAIIAAIYVRPKKGEVMQEFNQEAERTTRSLLQQYGGDVETYMISSTRTPHYFAGEKRYHERTILIVDDQLVTIHESLKFDASSRMPILADESQEIYYDQISSISYSGGGLEIGTSDGGTLRYPTTRKPQDALNDLQSRVREYKQQSA